MTPGQRVRRMAVLAAAYWVVAELGFRFSLAHPSVSPVWPPTGIALAGLLLLGLGMWPAVLLGAFAANVTSGIGAMPSALIALGNTAEAMVAAVALRGLGIDTRLARVRDVVSLIVIGAGCSTTLSASVGVITLCSFTGVPWSEAPRLWSHWWSGDAFGDLVFAPLVLAWASPPASRRRPSWREAAALAAAFVLVGVLVADASAGIGATPLSLAYTVFPLVGWAALRFGQRGATAANAAAAAFAIWGGIAGSLLHPSLGDRLALVQLFVAVVAIAALLLGAAIETEREARGRLHAGEAFLEAIERSAAVGLAAVDAQGRQSYVNPAFCRMVGWSREELLGLSPPFAYWPESESERIAEAFAATVAGTAPPEGFELRFQRRDGTMFDAHLLVAPYLAEGGRQEGWLASLHDVTHRRHAERQREQLFREQSARREAEQANRLKDDFLATLSHELRTPLNAIVGWCDMLVNSQVPASSSAQGLKVIARNANQLHRLISDVLEMSRIAAGKLSLTAEPCSLSAVAEAVVESARPGAEGRGLALALATDGPARVRADAARLQQVVENIVSNAIKFTPAGQVEVSVREEEGACVLRVRDTGIGIDPAFLPFVFDRFRQGDAGVNRSYGGLGLGLSIARDLAILQGGTLEAASDGAGQGACFTLRLPALDARDARARQDQRA